MIINVLNDIHDSIRHTLLFTRSSNVELLERVFMKNAASYKAVVLDGKSFDSDFWVGRAIDKQISNKSVAISGYWIREFLSADFRTTSA